MTDTTAGPFEQSFTDRKVERLICRSEDAQKFDWPERNNVEWYYSMPDAKTIGFHIGNFAPDMEGGTHRHLCEAIVYIIEGAGHTMIDDTRVDWKAGDAVFIPSMSWHSHHSGPDGARIIGIWNVPLMESLGLYYIEEAADTGHPDARPQARTTLLPE